MSIAEIYQSVIHAYDRQLNTDQGESWSQVLSPFPESEINRAVKRWKESVTTGYDGRPLGSKLPQPADIKQLIIEDRSQQQAMRAGEFVSCGRCERGWIGGTKTSVVYDPPRAIRTVKRCDCWWNYLCGVFGVSREDLPAELKRREEARNKASRKKG